MHYFDIAMGVAAHFVYALFTETFLSFDHLQYTKTLSHQKLEDWNIHVFN